MKKNIESSNEIVKKYIQEIINNNLTSFELIDGGQQRTVGDLIESKVSSILYNSNSGIISEKRMARSKKSIEDVTIVFEGITYYIDPKTHNIDSDFSMPNLTSIDKIKKLFLSDHEDLIYVFIDYLLNNGTVIIKNVKVFFIWELDISVLGIGALGKGQLQIKNANKDLIFTNNNKSEWYFGFKKMVLEFLNKQQKKINKQITEWE